MKSGLGLSVCQALKSGCGYLQNNEYIKANLNGSGDWESLHVPDILFCRNFQLLLKPILYILRKCLKTINLALLFSIFFFLLFFKEMLIHQTTYKYINMQCTFTYNEKYTGH